MAETIKQLRASRGYNKASITRLYTFVSNEADIEQSPLQMLHEKKDRLLQLFSEYENYNKQLLAADDKEEDPDLIEIEHQYTARAYQLERDTAEDPSVEDFLAFLEKRALALENSEQPYHAASGKQKVAMPVTATAEASPSCNYYIAAGAEPPEPTE